MVRTCKRCGHEKPLDEFRETVVPRDGGTRIRRGMCVPCEAEHRRESRHPKPKSGLSTIALIPDCHHPNADEAAWSLMLRALAEAKPSTIVVLGDFADGESLSLHEPDEPGSRDFKDEVGVVLRALTELDALGATRKIYIEGNHEQRLSRYLARRAPALFRSMSLPELLDLKGRGWEWVPYKASVKVGKLHLTHDTGSAGMNAHRTSARDFMGSVVIGHTHRMAYEVVGRFDDSPYLAAMLGWLGSRQAAKYAHEAKSASWALGFGLGYHDEATGIVHVQPIPIVGGTCVVQGRLVR